MNQILLRRLLIVLAIGILAGAFTLSRSLADQKQPPRRKPDQNRLKTVEQMFVENGTISTTLEVQGQLAAYDKIDVFSEVNGTLEGTAKPFKVGSYFPKGSILIRLDDTEAKLNLLSQKSNLLNAITQLMPDLKIDYPESFDHWKSYLDQFDLEKPIQDFPAPLNQQEKFFIASRNLHTQFYNIKSLEERLSKYTIYAPFSGVVTQTSINSGALVRTGQKIGELMNTGNYELEATVALSDLKYIKPGNTVRLSSSDVSGEWTGKIKRINDQVDPTTQTVKVFMSVSGKNLREGMYMRGEVNASSIDKAIKIPRKLLINQNSVYVIKNLELRLQEVEVVKLTANSVIIRGLEDGTPLLKDLIPGIFDGMKIEIKKSNNMESAGTENGEKPIGSLE